MQLFGATYIMWIERLMAGISHQHVLSYNPYIVMGMEGNYRWQTLLMLNDGKNCYIILNQEHKQRKSTVQEEQEVP